MVLYSEAVSAWLNEVIKTQPNDLLIALVKTFVARGIAAVGGLMLVVILGRLYGASGVGVFALAQGIYLGASILSRYGLDNAIMRYVGQDQNLNNAKTYLRWSLGTATILSFMAGFFVYISRENIASFFDLPRLEFMMVGFSIAIPAFTLSSVLAGFMKGLRKPATASLVESGSVSLLSSLIILILHREGFSEFYLVGWAIAFSAWVVFSFGIIKVFSQLSYGQSGEDDFKVSRKEFFSSSRAFLVLSLSSFIQQVVSILIAGWLLTEVDLGLFKSAERVALLISFSLLVVNSVLPPRFASLYQEGDLKGLAKLAKKGTWVGLVLASPLSIACLFFPAEVLNLLGEEFRGAELLLQVVVVGQLINVATGSVGFLLNMTGYEKLMRNIVLVSNLLGVVMFLVFIPWLGALGASLALAILIGVQNFTALLFVWRCLGIWTLPTPNFLSWIHTSANLVSAKREK